LQQRSLEAFAALSTDPNLQGEQSESIGDFLMRDKSLPDAITPMSLRPSTHLFRQNCCLAASGQFGMLYSVERTFGVFPSAYRSACTAFAAKAMA
jgi:hypothetical protein